MLNLEEILQKSSACPLVLVGYNILSVDVPLVQEGLLDLGFRPLYQTNKCKKRLPFPLTTQAKPAYF